MSPASLAAVGGAVVTVDGVGFDPEPGATTVSIGGKTTARETYHGARQMGDVTYLRIGKYVFVWSCIDFAGLVKNYRRIKLVAYIVPSESISPSVCKLRSMAGMPPC